MRVMLLAVCMGALATAGCVQTQKITGEKVSEEYTVGGFSWQSGSSVYVFVRTFEYNGNIAVCGAWAASQGSGRSTLLNEQVLGAGSIALDGTLVVSGLGFFPEHRNPRAINGRQTACVSTDRPWKPEYENIKPEVRFPSMTFS